MVFEMKSDNFTPILMKLYLTLCCAHTCGLPHFELLNDRRMGWSPIHPSAQGSSSDWVLQWVCRSCGSSTSMQDIPALSAVSCSQCSASAAIVSDRPTGRIARFYFSFQVTVPHDGDSPPPQTPVPPTPALPPNNDPPSEWFSYGPLSDEVSITVRLVASQSWLFCPLISLGLALAESRMGVPPLFHY